MHHSTERFSSRVGNYVKYRPTYPPEVLELLQKACGLGAGSVVADIGSGTGISASLLLTSGATVYGIEPNDDMRAAAEEYLGDRLGFHSIDGTAEDTTLPGQSVDLIVAAQAFHWFEPATTRKEFTRILKPSGWVALMWNDRITESTPFLIGYEHLLRAHMPEYLEIGHKEAMGLIEKFFRGNVSFARFQNKQVFDLEGLIGRVLSSSYAPELGHPGHEAMMRDLRDLFERTQENGFVEFLYNTDVFYGQLTP
jgi:ubiquinone/menaquinone biosynthesis C-methylase UbiE